MKCSRGSQSYIHLAVIIVHLLFDSPTPLISCNYSSHQARLKLLGLLLWIITAHKCEQGVHNQTHSDLFKFLVDRMDFNILHFGNTRLDSCFLMQYLVWCKDLESGLKSYTQAHWLGGGGKRRERSQKFKGPMAPGFHCYYHRSWCPGTFNSLLECHASLIARVPYGLSGLTGER